MTEYPIFAPHGEERLAAIVTVPDESPKSVVLFAQGLGAPRSHRYGVWSRTARRLADHQIASVRFDYPQLGDSTGSLNADMESPPVEELRAVLDLARKAVELEKYGIIANCMGLLAALEIATKDRDCKSLACFLTDPPTVILRDRGKPNYQQTARRMSRKVPKLRRLIRRYFHVNKGSLRHGLIPQVEQALGTTDVLFLLTGTEDTGRRLTTNVSSLRHALGKGPIGRAEVQTIVAEGTEQFVLPMTTHPQVVDALADWMVETLPSSPAKNGQTSSSSKANAPASGAAVAKAQNLRSAS